MFTAVFFTAAKIWKQHSAHRYTSGRKRSGTYTQWNITQPQQVTSDHLQQRGWT